MEPPSARDDRIAAVATLDQPLRRKLYELLADTDGWLTRDGAAAGLGVSRPVAAFHLDKLAEAGVAEVGFERVSGRTGPGAGRPSKVYRLVADEVSASMPDRHYDLAGRLLADAVVAATETGEPVDRCLQRAARDAGRAIGAEARGRGAGSEEGVATQVLGPLEHCGYEPSVRDDGEIALVNCPFHRLAQSQRSLVCGMNLDLLTGLLEGLEPGVALRAQLVPEPGYCCVRLRQR